MPRWEPLTDDQRFPLIPEARRGLLTRLRQHPHAPRWNMASGDRLNHEDLAQVRAWADEARRGPPSWAPGETPPWVDPLVERLSQTVPFYRARGGGRLRDHPSFRRADLARAPWSFVPDGMDLDALLVYPTSGTTGPAFDVYSHPVAASIYLAFVQVALADLGVKIAGGPDRVSVAAVHHQRGTYTYPSLMSYLGEAGFVKLNLHPDEWSSEADPAAFLDALDPEIYTGDPLAFDALARLPLRGRPRALISSAMTLTHGMRARLEARFRCPVLDLYSLTEARLIAVDAGEGYRVRCHDLYVEILHPEHDTPLPPGARGEITVTGGSNPLLPLLRYRTGDFGRVEHRHDGVWIRELEGRAPVALLDAAGALVNNIDVSRALAPFALPQFQLRQAADQSLTLAVRGEHDGPLLAATLAPLFGGLPISVTLLPEGEQTGKKVPQYLSEVKVPVDLAHLFSPASGAP